MNMKRIYATPVCENRWMDNLLFHALFDSIIIILGCGKGIHEILCAAEARLLLNGLLPTAGIERETACSASQRLARRATGLL